MTKLWVLFHVVPQIVQHLWKSLLLSVWDSPLKTLWFCYLYYLKCFKSCSLRYHGRDASYCHCSDLRSSLRCLHILFHIWWIWNFCCLWDVLQNIYCTSGAVFCSSRKIDCDCIVTYSVILEFGWVMSASEVCASLFGAPISHSNLLYLYMYSFVKF